MRTGRVLAVLGGITAAGAAVGAAAGLATAAVVGAFLFGPLEGVFVANAGIYGFAATAGAACGALLAPAASLAFLRRVPLGRLFAETWVGTVLAGSAGVFAFGSLPAMLSAGAAGFLLAGARLAWVYRARPELEGGEVEPTLLSGSAEA